MIRLLRGHCSPFFAPMDSCANPVGSPFLRFSLSLQIFPQMPGPLPRRSHRVLLPVSSSMSSAFPKTLWVGFPFLSANATFPRVSFSRLQTFRYVQASEFARLPDRSYRCEVPPTEQPRLLHPGISCFVASARSGYAIRPIQAIDGKRTFTFQDLQPCRLLQCLTNRTVSPFPAPAASHPACRFPALGAPVCFLPRFIRPIVLGRLSGVAWVDSPGSY